jgi:hypothetical protein
MRGEASGRAGSGAGLGDAGAATCDATVACGATLEVAATASEARGAPLQACADVAASWLDPEQHACFAEPEWRIALAERADFKWQHGAVVAQRGPTSNKTVHTARFNMTGSLGPLRDREQGPRDRPPHS